MTGLPILAEKSLANYQLTLLPKTWVKVKDRN